MSNVRDATIRDDRNAKLGREFGHLVNRCGLWSTNCHHFLGDADGPAPHSNSQTIRSSVDQLCSLLAGNDVTGAGLAIPD
jgi:hypothetical protein